MERSDNMPWIVEGDFNVILNEDEKLGGLPFLQQEAVEVKFTGSNYIWWNDRIEEESILKRLDRILVKNNFLEISHLHKFNTSSEKGQTMSFYI